LYTLRSLPADVQILGCQRFLIMDTTRKERNNMETNIKDNTLSIDGKETRIQGEKNLLDLIRNQGIEIPTFCYHSDLSVYSACRLCIVDVEGMGIVTSCSTPPAPGMRIKTSTKEIREIRRIAVELLLANHERECTTCGKNEICQLQTLARTLGVDKIHYKSTHQEKPLDLSNPSLIRNPNKCILCGDCVRACHERQGVGAIDFAHRGAHTSVQPAFGKELKAVECVYCGQCAAVCPTGAIIPRPETEEVFGDLEDPDKTVVVQIAPAVRVALGEHFGFEPGTITTGQMVAALKKLGFDQVYDTSFTADLTVMEETNEFLKRLETGSRIPQFTSCCPAWVKFAEQYYPDLLPHLSSCKSPQQMFGALARDILPGKLNIPRESLVVVSVMPCTAKKYEAKPPKFYREGMPEVNHVITTQELARMIEQRGLRFQALEPESFDLPFGFKTGAGVLFGTTGGVTEAVLRYASEKITGSDYGPVEFREVRGEEGIRRATLEIGGRELKIAVVYGLANAREIIEGIKSGEESFDFIEVMSCPGGCVGGAGQPVSRDREVTAKRSKGIYTSDRMLQFHKSQENPVIRELYEKNLEKPGSSRAHHLLHTAYSSKRRIQGEEVELSQGRGIFQIPVRVCLGTSCMVRGSQQLLKGLMEHLEASDLLDRVDVKATFCFENCDRGPTVAVGEKVLEKCTLEDLKTTFSELLKEPAQAGSVG